MQRDKCDPEMVKADRLGSLVDHVTVTRLRCFWSTWPFAYSLTHSLLTKCLGLDPEIMAEYQVSRVRTDQKDKGQ